MPEKPPSACRTCGRANCKEHRGEAKKQNDSYAVKSQRAYFKEYHSKRWTDLAASLKRHNPICQVIEAGERCKAPSSICHHLIAPQDDYSRLFDWTNLVCICASHHGHSEGESPDANRAFAPTLGATIGGVQAIAEHPEYQEHADATGMAVSVKLTSNDD